MEVYNFGNVDSNIVLIQLVGDHDMALLANEVNLIRELSGYSDIRLIAVKVDNWNDDLSPWESPAVFGPTSDELKLYIGGYSLAGLFAFWTIYQNDIFSGCVAASPSAWFPGLAEYISDKEPLTDKIYLSLGDKEEKTRNPVMSQVGNAIRRIYDQLRKKDDVNVTLEWNQGNHFKEPDLRTAKGFAWILNSTMN
ncbi:MAG: esterase [Eubacterium sp.]|nr:esterase [Eubacterium sp.]